MSTGLSVSDVVTVNVNFTPVAAALRNFGNLLIVGSSPVVDTTERLRLYTSLTAIASDFGTSASEYLAAQAFFAQTPTPAQVYVGRWAQTATSGVLHGALLTPAQQALSVFTPITTGSLKVTVDGVLKTLSALNFSGVVNLNGVASILTTALSPSATVTYNSNLGRFDVTSATTGVASTVTFASATGSGVDVSGLLGLQTGQGGSTVAGIAAETLLTAVTTLAGQSNDWYGLYVAAAGPVVADFLAVAGFIQGAAPSRIFGVTSADQTILQSAVTTDLASQMQALGYSRTFVQYSSTSLYAAAAIFGNAFTVNFQGSRTTITLKFKPEAGVAPETLSESQAAAALSKNCNIFVNYNNSTSILQNGTMSSGAFFDEIHGADWLQNDVQTAVYNLLLQFPKVPQTDAGVNLILATVESRLAQAVANGFVAPGVWTASGFGGLVTGQTLSKGYYTYAPPVATQSAADRGARKAPAIQAAIKLAGAIHTANIQINVNR